MNYELYLTTKISKYIITEKLFINKEDYII